MRDFKDRDSLLKHINESTNHIQVHKYGNHYISTGGQHRLCLAKFMGLSSVRVQVVEHYFDKWLFQREMNLKKHLKELISYGFDFYIADPEIEQDTITLKINNESIFVKKEFISKILASYKSIKKSWLKTNFLAPLNSLAHYNISKIESNEDIKKLYPLLAIHHKRIKK